MNKVRLFLFVVFLAQLSFGQLPKIHSHNDYYQPAPFWLAYNAGARSIEIDVILKDDQLFVAHSKNEIKPDATFEKLYVKPLLQLSDSSLPIHQISYLVDIKTESEVTLGKLIEITKRYPTIINSRPDGLKLVISGNRPDQKDFLNYPDYIAFDGRDPSEINKTGGNRIALISRNFSDFSNWKGKGKLPESDSIRIRTFVNECHQLNKAVRFWNTADHPNVYRTLINLGVDYINTDQPFELKELLEKYDAGKSLTEWKKSFPDIHHINTGRGNTTFAVFPDGTNMLIDRGDMSENHPGRLSARNTPALPNNIQSPAEWVADYIFQFHPQKQKAKLDYALIIHDHDNHFEEIDSLKPMHGCGQLFTNRDQIRTCLLTSNNSIYNYERR